ncbi:NADH-quinone oxidoreductase subunit M [Streptomyces sp. SID13031]|uniref:NADH-quinone oxidoreductase subunit M n=1 Tax=Streptomyces sp. SID13031 TaxID=2706046 RepID=UPI0013CB76E4|nr:NADH-quinone oxidoreductase subunit M [Streptomyces sp. SID13031]
MKIGWLTLTLLLPLVGALVTMVVPKAKALLSKQVALAFSLVTLALTIVIAVGYHQNGAADYEENHTWIKAFGAHYALGLDGVGIVLVVLTALLTPIVLIASWNDAKTGRWSEKSFFAWILGLEALSIGVFSATDVFLFYVLFEATLIPMYFLIGGFGGAQRSYAAVKFLLYSLLGGLLMLASVVGLYVVSAKNGGDPSYLLSDLVKVDMSQNTERWLFLGFFFAFAVKAPMVPFHTWLPDAAAEATPGTSVLLVGILDKIGTFGMIRFCLGLFPEASKWATPVVLVLALISVLYGALVAIGQTDIKRLIAYTSISHFGFIVMGIFALTSQGLTGSTLYMFNHGLSTAALFLVAGYLISRRGSARIADYGGVEKVAPVLAGTFLFAGLSSLALPGLSPFISEFMVLAGTFSKHKVIAVIAVLGIVLAALYILIMYQRLMTGPVRDGIEKLKDLNFREVFAITPLVVLIIGFGIYPKPIVDIIKPAVESTMQRVGVTDPAPQVPVTEGQK